MHHQSPATADWLCTCRAALAISSGCMVWVTRSPVRARVAQCSAGEYANEMPTLGDMTMGRLTSDQVIGRALLVAVVEFQSGLPHHPGLVLRPCNHTRSLEKNNQAPECIEKDLIQSQATVYYLCITVPDSTLFGVRPVEHFW